MAKVSIKLSNVVGSFILVAADDMLNYRGGHCFYTEVVAMVSWKMELLQSKRKL